jgi:hypothetical protein
MTIFEEIVDLYPLDEVLRRLAAECERKAKAASTCQDQFVWEMKAEVLATAALMLAPAGEPERKELSAKALATIRALGKGAD